MKLGLVPFCAGLALALSGCGGLARQAASAPAPASAPAAPANWREIATQDDRSRLRRWRTAWTEALAKARAAGRGAAIAQEGVLLQPDAGLPWQAPPAGNYSCRVIKLGARSQGLLDYVAYPAFNCRIRPENGVLSFAKLTGSQRPIGLIFPDTGTRSVFLGTLQLGDEMSALQYGLDRERDMAGVVERVGERRWRIALPYPHFESTIDVIELIPR